MSRNGVFYALCVATCCAFLLIAIQPVRSSPNREQHLTAFDRTVNANLKNTIAEGRETFRFDTFGDEGFWGDTLQLHKAIEGARFGGVGGGVSPKTALALGLKV